MKRLPKKLPNDRMTVTEAAGHLQISNQAVRNYIHTGNLIAHKEQQEHTGTMIWIITGISEKQKQYASQGYIAKKKADKPPYGVFAPGCFIGNPMDTHMGDKQKSTPKKTYFNTKNKRYE